jgi:hypothetical protein
METSQPLLEGEKVVLYCGVPAVGAAFGGMLLSAESVNSSINAAVYGEIAEIRQQNQSLKSLGVSSDNAGPSSVKAEISANNQLISNLAAREPALTPHELLGLDMGLSLIGGLAIGGIVYVCRRLWQEQRRPKAPALELGEFNLDLRPAIQGEL